MKRIGKRKIRMIERMMRRMRRMRVRMREVEYEDEERG